LDQATEAFRRAVEQRPADAVAYDALAQIFIRLGDFEEAAGMALEALGHDMQLFRAHYYLGIALMKLGRKREAITAFEAAARIDSNRAAPYYWLSRIAAGELADANRELSYREAGRAVIRQRRNLRTG
jgi:tetratricopeptide (TPR) repeat protein